MSNFRVAIIGAGAIGGYFAAALTRSGVWVGLVARGQHLKSIQHSGLHVQSPEGDFSIRPALVSSDPAKIGTVDAAIVAVKAWQLPEAATQTKQLLGAASRVLPIQNGVEAPSILRETIGREFVLDGTCRIVSELVVPGRIRHVGMQPTVHFGEADDGELSATSRALRDALSAAGVIVHTPGRMQIALWEKLHFLAPLSAVAAVTRSPVGDIRNSVATRELVECAMSEVARVANAVGADLPNDAIVRSLAMLEKLPDEVTVSMQRDIVAGKPSELDAIVGVVVRMGQRYGVPTPVMQTLHAALLPQEQRARIASLPKAKEAVD